MHNFAALRNATFGDISRKLLGEEICAELAASFEQRCVALEDRTNGRIPAVALQRTMRLIRDETPYEFAIDGIALNIASAPFILTDRIGTGSWTGALYTRATAFLPNFVTGRMFGAYQDVIVQRFDNLMKVSEEKRGAFRLLRQWPGRFTAFLTGQTWLYGAYLTSSSLIAGEEPSPERIIAGMLTLSATAPLVGPISDAVYQRTRVWCGLAARPGYGVRPERAADSSD